ncbi:restriction endonuclease [Haloarcula marina]|uniref:restriction endonuclease n=1 Tax=Haloarcula marina TaxID=2961574 RepID=UPI0020B7A69F|nr:restriction endonuclease [Halomicroarcula marina]
MKGKVLEQIVQKILLNQGYDRLNRDDPKFDPSTGKFEGRGADHELDAFGQYKHSIPFVNPIRLFGEAKCYKPNYSVGVDIIREAITVRKDIDENYESQSGDPAGDRRVECFAVFSTSGFSSSAIKLARAHGIYLVPLGHLRPVVDEILRQHNPQTHKEAENAVNTYFSEIQRNRWHFASITTSYPVALRGTLPEEMLSNTDSLFASATLTDSEVSNATQFHIEDNKTDSQWKLTTEVPTWMLEYAIDWSEDGYLSLVIPTVLNELTRQIRVELISEDLESVL